MRSVKILDKLVAAAAIALLTSSAAHALTVRGTPVTVMNTEPDGGSVPVVGKVAVTNTVPVSGSVAVTNTVPVTGSVAISGAVSVNVGNTPTVNVGNSPTVVIDNTNPISVQVSGSNLVPIYLTFGGTNKDWVAADVSLPKDSVLESVGLRCSYPSGAVRAGVSSTVSLMQGVSVSTMDPNMTAALGYQSNLVWPTVEFNYERVLPLTQVGLPVGRSFRFWVGGNSVDPINCTGTAVVRYLQ